MRDALRLAQLSQARNLGGVGSILLLLAIVPTAGPVLAIAGAIMTLFAIKYVSDSVVDPSIFRNALIAVGFAIAGLIVGAALILASVFNAIGLGAFSGIAGGRWIPGTPPPIAFSGGIIGLILGVLAGLAVLWILLILSAFFIRRSYRSMGSRLGVGMFGTAGLLYLIGAALTIVIVGFVVILVAEILNIVAFFSIPDQPVQQPQASPSPT